MLAAGTALGPRILKDRREPRSSSSGKDQDLHAVDDAQCGSRQLLAATQSLFRAWERTHGFQAGAAQILLLAGWQPK